MGNVQFEQYKGFYEGERLIMLKNIDLDMMLRANGYSTFGKTSQDPDKIGQHYKNSQNHRLVLYRMKTSGIMLALDYLKKENREAVSAWDLALGINRSRKLEQGADPVLHYVAKMNSLRQWNKASGKNNVPELLNYYRDNRDRIIEIENWERRIFSDKSATQESNSLTNNQDLKQKNDEGLTL